MITPLLLAAGTLALPQVEAKEIVRVFGNTSGSIELFVAPDGRVLECAVVESDISARREAELCADAIGTDLGVGAMLPDGTRVHGFVVISSVRMAGSNPPRRTLYEIDPDLEIGVARMPNERDSVRVELTVYIDKLGKVRTCLENSRQDAVFSRIACEQSSAHTFPIKIGQAGAAVDYVKNLAIDFVRTAG